jgi:transcriptional regulator with XRE-family HTH domain
VSDAGLADQVRQFRVAARLTQAELADRAGVSERAISDIERGLRARVYPVTARALADALGLAGEARASFERAAQAGRVVPAGHEPSVPSRSQGADRTSTAAGAEHWRAMRRAAMVGRENELAFLLRSLLRDGPRLHTITGPGGMGKSRLAAEVCADRADDGVAWVTLAALRQPEFVLSTIAAAAGLPPDASLTVLAAALDAGTSLLVLDTFEPVLAAANDVAGLLDQTTRLRMLITSRAPLRVRGERELLLRPLSATAAIELFRQRVYAARPDLIVEDPDAATAIEDIGRQLSGLPLALELAAAKGSIRLSRGAARSTGSSAGSPR